MEPRKQAIMAALDRFVAQRPGLEFGNYGDVKSYRSEMRSITRDRHDYSTLARAIERSDSITADDIIKAAESAFSGRLTIKLVMGGYSDPKNPAYRETLTEISYVTGQYFPTEYRKAAAAVLAAALWAHVREQCMPAPFTPPLCAGDWYKPPYTSGPNWKPVSAGDWLRAYFRREFGAGVARRWFS